MAKKEIVKLTSDGLNLMTVLDYSSIAEMNGFYQKEVFFTKEFRGNKSLLYQALGNLGAFARDCDFDKDISLIVISNSIIENFYQDVKHPFLSELEDKLNQNNSPYRRMKFISEEHLIWYIENRIKQSNDNQLASYIQKYKDSRKETCW